MSTVHVPAKTLFGAMILGTAVLGIAKLISNAARLRTQPDGDPHGQAADGARRSAGGPAARQRRGQARAPYADGLSQRTDEASHLPGMAAPVKVAKQGGGLGEPFSAGAVSGADARVGSEGNATA